MVQAEAQVVALYLPSGSSSEERQQVKFSFMERFMPHLRELMQSGREVILCGNWNIAHAARDVQRAPAHADSPGFLAAERQWLDSLFGELGYVDAFRAINGDDDEFSWWPGGRASADGWRST